MKRIYILVLALFCCGFAKAQLPSTSLFEQIVLKVNTADAPPDYGLTADVPVYVGANVYLADPQKMNVLMGRFYKTFTWPDGTYISFTRPETTMGKFGSVDKYTIVQPGKTDTIKLYVDMFKQGPIYIPKGLALYSKATLATELAPTLQKIKALFATPDAYGDSTAKVTSFQLVSFLQTNIGLTYLLDNDALAPVLNDKMIDLDLKAFLVRAYMFHKLEFEAVDDPKPKDKAYNAMLADFTKAFKAHPKLAVGSVAALKPKP